MLSDGKIIYSKRFPQYVSEKQYGKDDGIDEELPGYSPPSFEEFLQHITENSVYIARFDKMAKKDYFILAAIDLSLKYEIDMTIAEYFHYVRVTIYAACSAYTREIKSIITALFSMCDQISTFLSKEDPYDFIVCLDYYTHDHYLSGKKMND